MTTPARQNSTDFDAACVSVCQNPTADAYAGPGTHPQQATMKPNWLHVDHAITLFKSGCAIPMHAADNAVADPNDRTIRCNTGLQSAVHQACCRCKTYTPAVTRVAAWMRALTGVGPAIADGSHKCKLSWADLPARPPSRSSFTPTWHCCLQENAFHAVAAAAAAPQAHAMLPPGPSRSNFIHAASRHKSQNLFKTIACMSGC